MTPPSMNNGHQAGSRVVSPTGSYAIEIPQCTIENHDERLASFWQEGSNVLLQISSYMRIDGQPVPAGQRLDERIRNADLTDADFSMRPCIECPDLASATVTDKDGVAWVFTYAVWPDLTILATISGTPVELEADGQWALDALRTLRRM